MSIARKMLIAGVALVTVPVVVVGWYAYHISSDGLNSLGKERASQVAVLAAGDLTTAIESQITLVREVALGNTVIQLADAITQKGIDGCGPELKATGEKLKRFMDILGRDYETLIFTAKKGISLVDGRGEKFAGIDVSTRGYFQAVMKGESLAIQTVISKSTGKPIMVFGVPVKNSKGALVGMIGAILKLESWSEKILDNRLGQTGYVYVMDKDGLVVIHPDPTTIMKVNLAQLEGTKDFVSKVVSRESGVLTYDYEGSHKIAGFSTISVTGWKVVATQDMGEFLGPVYEIRNGVIVAGVFFVVLAVILVVYFARRISIPLARAAQVADSVAAGDLTQRMKVLSRDEVGSLAGSLNAMAEVLEKKSDLAMAIADGDLTREVILASDRDTLGRAFQKMVANLNETIAQIQEAVSQVAEGSGQVSDSSQALSQGATEQAASLEEITSSLTQIGSQTTTNAENASQVNQLSETVRGAADIGNSRMTEMITAMQDINGASKEIAKIIKTIDDIAFQTNLLALNAAVEAARAGKHGKGFAVVAQEVRNLAGRSAKAAKETEALIDSTVKKVQAGTDVVGQTAESLEDIRGGVTKMADLTGEIAAASREQAAGIKQINQGLGQIDQVTQQNTASAEETASASQELSSQAARLRRTLQTRFKIRAKAKGDTPSRLQAERVPAPKEISRPRAPKGRGSWEETPLQDSKTQHLDPDAVISLDDPEFGRY